MGRKAQSQHAVGPLPTARDRTACCGIVNPCSIRPFLRAVYHHRRCPAQALQETASYSRIRSQLSRYVTVTPDPGFIVNAMKYRAGVSSKAAHEVCHAVRRGFNNSRKEVPAAQPDSDQSCTPKRKAGSCIPALPEISIRPSLIVNPCSVRGQECRQYEPHGAMPQRDACTFSCLQRQARSGNLLAPGAAGVIVKD